jgi:ABC-type sugar transport system permease subunit
MSMATTSYVAGVQAETVAQRVSRSRAQLNEAILGLLFVAPVAIIAFIFELFPVAYGFFISMQGGVNVPEGFVGLANFVRVIGSLAYMIALAVSLVFVLVGYNMYRRGVEASRNGQGNFYRYLPVGYLTAFATLTFFGVLFTLDFSYALIPLGVLLIGVLFYALLQPRNGDPDAADDQHLAFVLNSWGVGLMTLSAVLLTWFTFYELHRISQPLLNVLSQVVTNPRFSYVYPLLPQIAALFGAMAAVGAIFVAHRVRLSADPDAEPRKYGFFGIIRWLFAAIALVLVIYVIGAQDALRQTLTQFERVPRETLRAFTRVTPATLVDTVSQWNEVFTMILGLGFIGLAYFFWSRAKHRETTSGMLSTLLIAIALMVGGWMFIGELPLAAGRGDTQFYDSIIRTATYAFLTVPVQLSLGLLLAYMLFYEVRSAKASTA